MAQTATVKLQYPIKDNGKEITELTIGRLKAKHLRLIPKDVRDAFQAIQEATEELEEGQALTEKETQQILGDKQIDMLDLLPLIASMAGISEPAADDIDVEDLPAVWETVMDFLSGQRASQDSGVRKGGVIVSGG